MATREEWKAAKAEVEAIEAERRALLAPTEARYLAAEARLEDIEGDLPEFIGRCEGCTEPVWEGDLHSYDSENGLVFCEECSPTWRDMQNEPENFYNGDGIYYTAETVKPVIEAHLAKGGSLDDKMVRR